MPRRIQDHTGKQVGRCFVARFLEEIHDVSIRIASYAREMPMQFNAHIISDFEFLQICRVFINIVLQLH